MTLIEQLSPEVQEYLNRPRLPEWQFKEPFDEVDRKFAKTFIKKDEITRMSRVWDSLGHDPERMKKFLLEEREQRKNEKTN